jgi:tungstate transport system substrate-binding protein
MGKTSIAPMAAILLAVGCGGPPARELTLTLATTTSTQDSGLLDALVPMFRRESGVEVKVVAVGSGQALELGRRGDADVVLAHSPAAEERFMAEGFGESRRAVMSSDFVLVGPPGDPAGLADLRPVSRAFAAIARGGYPFVSRGDESGTHRKEIEIWKAADIEPGGDWYVQAGTGMAQALRMADQKRAYTLSDRATFLAQRAGLDLKILGQGDRLLDNEYHVIVVSPAKHPGVHAGAAREFAGFLVSPGTQGVIAEFGRDRYGEPLFRVAGAGRPDHGE